MKDRIKQIKSEARLLNKSDFPTVLKNFGHQESFLFHLIRQFDSSLHHWFLSGFIHLRLAFWLNMVQIKVGGNRLHVHKHILKSRFSNRKKKYYYMSTIISILIIITVQIMQFIWHFRFSLAATINTIHTHT